MRDEGYWSDRQGRGPKRAPSITTLARALDRTVAELGRRDFLQEWFGYWCVDRDEVPGRARGSIAEYVEDVLGWRDAWPLPEWLLEGTDGKPLAFTAEKALTDLEDSVFDLIEFFLDHSSEGVAGKYHDYNECGWHYSTFRKGEPQRIIRERLNPVLARFGSGFTLTGKGRIENTSPPALASLLSERIHSDDDDLVERVQNAVASYRRRDRSRESQRLAVRDLFDVLERLRPAIRDEMLKGDESDLFHIANRFAIRHFNENQKSEYDSLLWLSWMFHVNLATVHLITRLIERGSTTVR